MLEKIWPWSTIRKLQVENALLRKAHSRILVYEVPLEVFRETVRETAEGDIDYTLALFDDTISSIKEVWNGKIPVYICEISLDVRDMDAVKEVSDALMAMRIPVVLVPEGALQFKVGTVIYGNRESEGEEGE